MILNYTTAVTSSDCNVILVPYRAQHVKDYHSWMQDTHLQEATGSEPLTMDEEYEMQESWKNDPNKCTFIILDKGLVVEQQQYKGISTIPNNIVDEQDDMSKIIGEGYNFIINNTNAMIGDVNLFLSELDDSDCDSNTDKDSSNDNTSSKDASNLPLQAEIDLMIAVPNARRRGFGYQAAVLMLLYSSKHMPNIKRYFCKINDDNDASISLFTNRLGFAQCGYAACFRQVELEVTLIDGSTGEDDNKEPLSMFDKLRDMYIKNSESGDSVHDNGNGFCSYYCPE